MGGPIAATDRDDDTLDYTLEGADAGSFDILSTSDGGQIRTSASLNHEEKSSYAVTVRVRDGRGGTDAVNVTINVTDVDGEAPDMPFAPTVTAVSSTRLQVSWDAPANQGPPITDYDYRYREPSDDWTEVTEHDYHGDDGGDPGTGGKHVLRRRGAGDERGGTSDWSNPGIGSTNAPGANNPPVFTDGVSTRRSVSADAPSGTNIGEPVRATDADSGDTVSYRLEGRDAGLFEINTATGQLLTKSGITLIASEEYTVIVVADDETELARITVTIAVTAAPPNSPPAFRERTQAPPGVWTTAPPRARTSALPVPADDPGRHPDLHAGRYRRGLVRHRLDHRSVAGQRRPGRSDQVHIHGDGNRHGHGRRQCGHHHGDHHGDHFNFNPGRVGRSLRRQQQRRNRAGRGHNGHSPLLRRPDQQGRCLNDHQTLLHQLRLREVANLRPLPWQVTCQKRTGNVLETFPVRFSAVG